MSKKYLLWKRALRTALLVLLLSAMGMGKGYAQSFTVGDLKYYVNTNGTTVTVSGHVSIYGAETVNIPSSVSYNGTTYNVTSIGSRAFYQCSGIISVTIPNSVTSIGNMAFYECVSLKSISIPDAVTIIGSESFCHCENLTSVTIPNSVTSIGSKAFYNCVALTSITIPNSVTSVEDNTFFQCRSLTSITIPNMVTSIGESAFCGSGLTSIVIPNSVISVGQWAFGDCHNLTSATISNSMNSISYCMFAYCWNLASISIPNTVSSIESGAFKYCEGLTSITIPSSVTSIGHGAFAGCSSLSTVSYYAIDAHYQNKSANYSKEEWVFPDCPNLTTLCIGSDVETIDGYIFKNCSSVHLVEAMSSTPAILSGPGFSDLADNSILIVPCGNRLTYYSVWNKFDFNNIIEDCGEYAIDLNGIGAGGSVSASSNQAQMGQTVTLTVTPNSGMMLSSISVANATDPSQIIPIAPVGKASSIYSFVMPPFGVKVSASFMAGTSVGEYESIEANVYPNPTNGQLKIEAEGIKHVTVSNALGQVIYEGKTEGDVFEYDFSHHGEGIYLIRIETANGVAVKKVTVTR